MKTTFYFFKLLRIPNLLFVALLMFVVRYAIVLPILEVRGMALQMPCFYFILLVIANCVVMGAGYIINDYFDTRVDAINRPDEVIVGRLISRRMSLLAHQVLTCLGILIGAFLAWQIQRWSLLLVYPLIGGLLWFYSSTYKREFLLGNLVVTVVAMLIPISVIVFEGAWLQLAGLTGPVYVLLWDTVMIYTSCFALFILSLELISDQMTAKGDSELECKTVAVVWGLKGSKWLVALTVILTIVFLAYVYCTHSGDYKHAVIVRYLLSGFGLPLLLVLMFNLRAHNYDGFKMSYRAMQFALVALLLFPLLLNYLFAS